MGPTGVEDATQRRCWGKDLGSLAWGGCDASQDAKGVIETMSRSGVFVCLSSSICMMVNSLRQHDLKARLFSTVSASKVVREPIKRRPARHPQKRLQ